MNSHNQIPHSRCIPPPETALPEAGFDNARFAVEIVKDRMNTQLSRRMGVVAALILTGLLVGCQPGANVVANDKAQGRAQLATNNEASVATNTAVSTSAVTNTSVLGSTAESTNTTGVVAPPVPPPNVTLGEATTEIIKMAQGGLSDVVLVAFVHRAIQPFDLSSEDILYLNDLGLSSEVIAAMLSHDGNAGTEVGVQRADAVGTPVSGPQATSQAPADAPLQTNPAPPVAVPAEAAAPAQQYQTVYQVEAPAQVIQAMPPEQQVTYQYFYSSLAPYGSWVTVDGYGLCWRPSVSTMGVGWQPYLNSGRWYHSDYGWYWHSDYSWGWAPFHYGRWARHGGYGWVWIPDTTWGPAWVDWRYNNAYCGWAPLPPSAHWRAGVGFSYVGGHSSIGVGFGLGWDAYVVVGLGNLCGRRPVDHLIGRPNAQHFYNNSTTVNINGNNNNVYINSGVPVAMVAGSTRGEIPRLAVRETPNSTTTIRPEKISREGSTLVVHRPTGPSVHTQASDIVARAEAAPLNRPASNTPVGTPRTVAPASGLVATPGGPTATRQEMVRPTLPTALRPQTARSEVSPAVPSGSREITARTTPSGNPPPVVRRDVPPRVPNTVGLPSGVNAAAQRQETPTRGEPPSRPATPGTVNRSEPVQSNFAPTPAQGTRSAPVPATVYRSEPAARLPIAEAARPPTVYRTEPVLRNAAPVPAPAPVYRAPVQPAPAQVYRPAPAAPAPVYRAPAPVERPAPSAPAPSQGQAPSRPAPSGPGNVHREPR